MNTAESWLPLVSFAFVSSITPGPNNLMLAASGVAFGWRRTIPHMLGVPSGFGLLLLVCGLGVGALIAGSPAAGLLLKLVGSAYLLYLTWVLRNAFTAGATTGAARPIRFYEAFLFQFLNPKGWIMAITAAAVFIPPSADMTSGLMRVLAIFVAINIPCILTWVMLGVTVRRRFNARGKTIASAVLILLTLYTVVAIWL
jgi:threonine/homoserine/homoserine lactone efflux protein